MHHAHHTPKIYFIIYQVPMHSEDKLKEKKNADVSIAI
jgi:hypothetical protein